MNKFIEEIKIIPLRHLFFIQEPIKLCKLPYPGHARGCPNAGFGKDCPPRTKRLEDKYDLSKPHFFCYVKFNIEKQKLRMKFKHPEWTDRQCKCLLYWQNSVRKRLVEESIYFCSRKTKYEFDPVFSVSDVIEQYDYELIPEAMGLHVFETAAYHGIILERSPVNYVYKIAFIGVLNA